MVKKQIGSLGNQDLNKFLKDIYQVDEKEVVISLLKR